MREVENIVQFSKKIPLSFSVIKFDNIFLHMHSVTQLIVVLEGEVECYIDNKKYIAKENDIFIVNQKVYHKFSAKPHAIILSVLIDPKGFGLEDIEADKLMFNLNSMENVVNKRHDNIRYLVYSIIKYNSMENINSIYTNRAIAFSLFAQLMNDFQVNITESDQFKGNYDILTQITSYIYDHYNENLTLSYLSNHFSYSVAYLSRLFKRNLGQNFIDYYDNLRINYSINDLLSTNNSLETIASDHGFDSARSYQRAFLNIYKVNPSTYRREYKSHIQKNEINQPSNLKKEALDKIISSYDNDERTINSKRDSTRDTEALVSLSYKGKTIALSSPQKRILQFPDCKYLFDKDIVENLKTLKKDIDFEYITINTIENIDSNFILQNDGDIKISTLNFKRILDILKELNLKPYFKFKYDPFKLTQEQYLKILGLFAMFIENNYEKEEINNWMFNVSLKNINTCTKIEFVDFLHFYEKIYLFTRGKYKTIKIGSPSFTKEIVETTTYLSDFVEYCKSKSIDVSFYSIEYKDENTIESKLSKNKEELKDFINKLKEKRLFFENKMYFENINFTSNKSLLNDTIYSSSYLCKNLIDNIKSIHSYGKLGFSDLINYSSSNDELFGGNNGFFTYNSIKKPAYNAFCLFAKLGNKLLKKSQNYIVTLKDDKIIILINNYSHYSALYAENEYYEISNQARYHCFPKSTNINFKILIKDLKYSSCKIKTTSLSQTSGSSFDKWLEMGAPHKMNQEELDTLKRLSEMNFFIENKNILESKLLVDCTVSPLETKLIEIELFK